jgi:hypothetical protein
VPPRDIMSVAIYAPQRDVGDTIYRLVRVESDR